MSLFLLGLNELKLKVKEWFMKHKTVHKGENVALMS